MTLSHDDSTISIKRVKVNFVIAPQNRLSHLATAEALRYMARTKRRRTHCTCLKPSQPLPVLIYRPLKDGGLSKPRPRVQRATGPRLLRDHPRPARPEPRPRDRKSSTLTTRLSRHPINIVLVIIVIIIT